MALVHRVGDVAIDNPGCSWVSHGKGSNDKLKGRETAKLGRVAITGIGHSEHEAGTTVQVIQPRLGLVSA